MQVKGSKENSKENSKAETKMPKGEKQRNSLDNKFLVEQKPQKSLQDMAPSGVHMCQSKDIDVANPIWEKADLEWNGIFLHDMCTVNSALQSAHDFKLHHLDFIKCKKNYT